MFDLIIREAASRFGLGDKAGPLVQMLLAYFTNKDTGGCRLYLQTHQQRLGQYGSIMAGRRR